MRDFSLRDRQTTGLQALMHLRDRAMFPEPPGADEGNDIQAKFAMGQRPASFFFGMISHMIQRTGGGGTLIHDHSELPEALQGHHLPSTVIGHPQAASARFTGLPKRCQRSAELCFRSRGSSRHGPGSCCKKRSTSLSQRTPAVKRSLPFSPFFYGGNLCLLSFSSRAARYCSGDLRKRYCMRRASWQWFNSLRKVRQW